MDISSGVKRPHSIRWAPVIVLIVAALVVLLGALLYDYFQAGDSLTPAEEAQLRDRLEAPSEAMEVKPGEQSELLKTVTAPEADAYMRVTDQTEAAKLRRDLEAPPVR